MPARVKRHLAETYPEHHQLFGALRTLPKLKPREFVLPEGVVRVVIGQMLSGAVADILYARAAKAARARGLLGTWLLDEEELRSCGLSRAKVETIRRFGARIGNDANALEHWRKLGPDDLQEEIKTNKGMGDWTAAIIALGYVGHEDVFPYGDGSLSRAVELLQRYGRRRVRRYVFDPDKARPYRSYLALYLWQALDCGALDGYKT